MKKLLVVLLAALMLVGCYDKTASITGKNTVLVTLDNKTITKGNVYSVMGKVDPYPAVVALTLSKKIILAKEIGKTTAVVAAADAALAAFLETNKADVAAAITTAGYKDQTDIYDNKFIVEAESDSAVTKYLTDTYSTIVSTYIPQKARVMEIKTAADAALALAAIKAGSSFATVAKKYGDSAYSSDLKIYYTGSSLPAVVLSFLKAATLPTLSDVIADTDNNLYYIVQVSVADGNTMKDEVINEFKTNSTFIELALMGYYTSDKFRIYDRPLYDMIKTDYPTYILK